MFTPTEHHKLTTIVLSAALDAMLGLALLLGA